MTRAYDLVLDAIRSGVAVPFDCAACGMKGVGYAGAPCFNCGNASVTVVALALEPAKEREKNMSEAPKPPTPAEIEAAELAAKQKLVDAKAAHRPLAADDAKRGAKVKLKPGARADTTDMPKLGGVEGGPPELRTVVLGVIMGDPRSSKANVEWEDKTWSVVDLVDLELVEEAAPAPMAAKGRSSEALEGRLSALEQAETDRLARMKANANDPAKRFVTAKELADVVAAQAASASSLQSKLDETNDVANVVAKQALELEARIAKLEKA